MKPYFGLYLYGGWGWWFGHVGKLELVLFLYFMFVFIFSSTNLINPKYVSPYLSSSLIVFLCFALCIHLVYRIDLFVCPSIYLSITRFNISSPTNLYVCFSACQAYLFFLDLIQSYLTPTYLIFQSCLFQACLKIDLVYPTYLLCPVYLLIPMWFILYPN